MKDKYLEWLDDMISGCEFTDKKDLYEHLAFKAAKLAFMDSKKKYLELKGSQEWDQEKSTTKLSQIPSSF